MLPGRLLAASKGRDMLTQFSELDLMLRWPFETTNQPILVDVGGHRGTVSKAFAARDWRVIAFEPEPENYRHFCTNLQDYPQVTCIHKAVSNEAGKQIPFFVSNIHSGIHAMRPFHATHERALTVETVRLDATLAEMDLPEVSLLKVDVEGADFLVLQGFDFTRYQPEMVICEFMDDRSRANYSYTHHDMVRHLAAYGYTAFVAEWAPIIEYARPGKPSSHTFLQICPYPLDHEPAWGNLIWVPTERADTFAQLARHYLAELAANQSLRTITSGSQQIKHGLRALLQSLRAAHAPRQGIGHVGQAMRDLLQGGQLVATGLHARQQQNQQRRHNEP